MNSRQGPATIFLSRTGVLQDRSVRPEYGTQIKVEGEDGSAFLFLDSLNGRYSYPQLFLKDNVNYRLHITTSTGKEYASEYKSLRQTPPVDSVTWQMENNGLRLYGSNLFPTIPKTLGNFGVVVDFYAANMKICVDCTTRRVSQKPPFWP
jgi:uncharacterized protein DUF4249